jgi:flagellar biosynthetic protein FlhB
MSLAKVIVIGGVAMLIITMQIPQILKIGELDLRPICLLSWGLLFSLGIKLAAVLVVLAVLDYMYQRHQHEKDMRMSKEEVKEEMKRMEGDPLVKQRRSQIARQLAMQRVSQAVPKADVVVTNPTHFAVALRYDADTMAAPKVVAKGADYMALRIRQLAMANDVPLVERKTLARGLYQAVEVGQEVPPQYFSAVAEILAYVYRLSGTRVA